MPQYDPVAKKVYVNLQDQNIIAVIDPATDEVVGRYPVGCCKGNHGMTLIHSSVLEKKGVFGLVDRDFVPSAPQLSDLAKASLVSQIGTFTP